MLVKAILYFIFNLGGVMMNKSFNDGIKEKLEELEFNFPNHTTEDFINEMYNLIQERFNSDNS